MAFAVGPEAARAGCTVRTYETLDSTNSEAMRLAKAGARGPLWIVANRQTAGRGRQGRVWQSSKGNLATSLLLSRKMKTAAAATLGFVAGLSLHDACAQCAPGLALSLKWPNDLLAGNGKLAGLLLESETVGDELALVIGFGVNVADAPGGLPYPAVSLAELGPVVSREHLFASLTDAFVRYDRLWDHGGGFPAIRRLWLERAQGVGQSISVQMDQRVEHGIFETLDEGGHLILRRADGSRMTVAAGDVHFGAREVAGASR